MPGYDPIRNGAATGVLPGTVLAAHLESSAAGLASGLASPNAGACLGRVADLAEIVQHVVAGQQHLSGTLTRLAEHVHGRHTSGPLAAVSSAEIRALTEVLNAASDAIRHSAEALAESAPILENVRESAGPDTHL